MNKRSGACVDQSRYRAPQWTPENDGDTEQRFPFFPERDPKKYEIHDTKKFGSPAFLFPHRKEKLTDFCGTCRNTPFSSDLWHVARSNTAPRSSSSSSTRSRKNQDQLSKFQTSRNLSPALHRQMYLVRDDRATVKRLHYQTRYVRINRA